MSIFQSKIKPKRKKNYKIIFIAIWKKFIKILPIIVILSVFIFFVYIVTLSPTTINIENTNKNIDTQAVLKSIKHLKNPLNIVEIKNTILKNPWVKNITLSRNLNTLKIKIIPQNIIFNWHNLKNNSNGYINNDGELFIPEMVIMNKKITIISNKKNIKNASNNLKKYQQIFKAPIKNFTKTGIEIITLKNGAKIILGEISQLQRLKNLQKYYHKFKMRPNSIVDLRYQNGFSKTN